MIRTLFLILTFMFVLGAGLVAPFVATLGYVWVDTFQPQAVAYFLLNRIPVAQIMAIAAVGGYFLMDRRSPPRFTLVIGLTAMLVIWVTMTTLLWAELPNDAFGKWTWAVKTVAFSAFIPFVIRSRVQIEAFVQTFVFSLSATLIPFGAKIAISGGGYGRELGLSGGNTGLSEGSTLAAVSVMVIPLVLHLRKHTIIIPKAFAFRQMYLALAAAAVLTTIGTYERTGLIGLIVVGLYMFVQSKNKIGFAICVLAVAATIAYTSSAAWTDRISTITNPESENSALGRILVWKWTLNYVTSHPLGGGFAAYMIDRLEFPSGAVQFGLAFHSIYFEVLGEHGWIGLGLFLGMMMSSLLTLQKARRVARKFESLAWCADLAGALQVALAVLMTCGAFIGIAFQPWLYYLFALSVSVSQYVRRVTLPDSAVRTKIGSRPLPTPARNLGLPQSSRVAQAEPPAAGTGLASSLRTAWRPGTSR